ncbi:Hamartin [Trinorchestia longiramus]|nr:Hamartin [Trinorchestia longiramus]
MSGNAVLDIRELLGYLECPTTEVSEEAKALLHSQLNDVRDSWLIAGLLNYFLESNSPHVLDLLLSAPEHHDKHFLTLMCEGLKQPSLRFRYTCLLFQGLRRSPPPSWLRRLPRHAIMRELHYGFDNCSDVTSMVAGVAVVVTLVTVVPHDVARYCLTGMLDMFWQMLHWTPKQAQDSTFTDFLRVTLYTLFTRLYSLFPCNVVNYIRRHTINPENRLFFTSTLQPMVERVRLHPMLFSSTKELEVDNKLNIWRDSSHALMQCSRISLDPVESTCEEPPVLHDPDVCKASFVAGTKCWVHASLDSFFWSPSHTQSPNPVRLDLPSSNIHTPLTTPHTTPIYSKTPLRVNVSLSIPESPPEAAVEATPETTPYTTPLLSDVSRQMRVQSKALPSNVLESSRDMQMLCNSSNVLEKNRSSIMLNKIDALQKERERAAQQGVAKNGLADLDSFNHTNNLGYKQAAEDASSSSKISVSKHDSSNCSVSPCLSSPSTTTKNLRDSCGSFNAFDVTMKKDVTTQSNDVISSRNVAYDRSENRRRKKSVFTTPDVDMLEFTKDNGAVADSPSPGVEMNNKFDSVPRNDEKDSEKHDDNRKVSTESKDSGEEEYLVNDEERGLGPPSVSSITALVKTAKSNRLRFLSQCGPPLDAAQIASIMPHEKRERKISASVRHRSKSCSSLDSSCRDVAYVESPSAMQASMLPRLPSNLAINRYDVGTQTVTSESTDPCEKLIETFISAITLPPASTKNDTDDSFTESQSPHFLLRNYIQRKIIDVSDPLPSLDLSTLRSADDKLRSQIYSMYSLLLLERHKREIHANRNRSLLAKTKRMHVFIEEKNGLSRKLDSYHEDTQNLKSSNLYMSSCYQRMKDSRDKENAEKEALLKDYSEGKKLQLTDTIQTTLSRTVKTSKGQESKDVIVLIHRPSDNQEDHLKDELLSLTSALSRNLRHACDEREALKLEVSALQQNERKQRNNEESMELVLREKELIRQRMSVIMTRLTILEELNLELQEKVHSLENELSDTRSKHKTAEFAWHNHREEALSEKRVLRGLTSAATLRLRQLQQQHSESEGEHERQVTSLKQVNETQRNQILQLESELLALKKERDSLRYNLSQVSVRSDVFKHDLHLLRSHSGYSRSSSATSIGGKQIERAACVDENPACDDAMYPPVNAFFNSDLIAELKPLPSEPLPGSKQKNVMRSCGAAWCVHVVQRDAFMWCSVMRSCGAA